LVAESIRGELNTQKLSEQSLAFLAEYTGAKVGVAYEVSAGTGLLKRSGGYAFASEAGAPEEIRFGEGLIGQAAAEKKSMVIDGLSAPEMKLQAGTVSALPTSVAIIPLTADGSVKGVAELGYLKKPSSAVQELLEEASEALGIGIRSAQHRARLRELLDESQRQAEELQAQQEELRVTNEELEQQMNALKEAQMRLENQQAELEQNNQQLEEQTKMLERQKEALDQRNQDLIDAQAALRRNADELQRSSQYKSEFLANMSHELRTPLNSSLILARLLADNRDGNLSREQVQFAETIYSSGNDLLDLINDVLDLSKVEAGKLDVRPEPFGLRRLYDGLQRTFEPLADKKGLKFSINVDDDAPDQMTSDRMRLEQILKNLLSNAIKFTEKGSVELRVGLKGDQIRFGVKDTGIGIAPEQQEVIFEAFRQADGTTNRKFGGTGLGLSISRELSKLLGGTIEVHSDYGKGSEFVLQVPIVYVEKAESASTKSEVTPSVARETSVLEPQTVPYVEPAPIKLKSKAANTSGPKFQFADDRAAITDVSRVMLIVEDDETFAKSLFDLAHEMKFEALVASTAGEGIDLARQYKPQAIVLDIRLPDHSGLAVLDQLKGDPTTRHIPVHVISGEDFAKAAYRMGAVGYMLKPVKRDQLVRAFEQMQTRINQKMKRLLIVEDDKTQQEALIALVADPGVEVTAVTSASEVFERLSKETFDCMILDLTLPDLGGFELLEKLADADSPYSYPPVIVYTGKDLSRTDEERLRRFSESIIIKGARSPERLLSEVTLFLHRVEAELPPERQKMLHDLRNREKGLEGRTILVVDDDVRNIFALTGVLEPRGAKVEVARNGVEALDKLDKLSQVDLVLMDIMMPEMDGYEAMKRIRAQKKFEKLPIIAVTAKAMRDDQEKCIAAGASDYLAKPIQIDKLMSLIRIWMPARRSV
jgi:signal transduction histidine kinase/CheY-like chemotaxis protein